ncbi:hypothetical protein [Rhizobium cauense]|uniref:hypothetical protein n=1 Tax=Rhizobium cauense TaxID=1166683 RepID=UPI001C6EC0C8|nr:hypothetical protein [Rhizobium cauense]
MMRILGGFPLKFRHQVGVCVNRSSLGDHLFAKTLNRRLGRRLFLGGQLALDLHAIVSLQEAPKLLERPDVTAFGKFPSQL